MSKQNIEIEVPEGFKAKYNPETQTIEFVKKISRARTWKEFCCKNPSKENESYIGVDSRIICKNYSSVRDYNSDKNVCVSKEEASAFLALMQLRQLRNNWINDWKPTSNLIYGIHVHNNEIKPLLAGMSSPLTFPDKETTEEFVYCFKDLLEVAKILL